MEVKIKNCTFENFNTSYDSDELIKDLIKLSEHSQNAKELLNNEDILVCRTFDENGWHNEEYFSTFHPNGKCGCVELDDDYMFNIRCNHLIWIDGSTEDHQHESPILIIGNHKGCLYKELIMANLNINKK